MAVSVEGPTRIGDLTDVERSAVGARSAGDADFDRLWREYLPRVRALVRKLLPNRVAVEDIVQETFLRGYNAGVHLEYRDQSRTRSQWPWLATVARNLCLDHRRRQRGITIDPFEESEVEPAAEARIQHPESSLLASVRRDGISEALDEMHERQARVLVLKHLEGLSYREIAEQEGVSIDALKSLLARARRAFKESYASVTERRGLGVAFPLLWVLRRLRGLRNRFTAAPEAVAQAASATATVPGALQALATVVVLGVVAGASPVLAATTGGSGETAHDAVDVVEIADVGLTPPPLAVVPAASDVNDAVDDGDEAKVPGSDDPAAQPPVPVGSPAPTVPDEASADSDAVIPGDDEPASASGSVKVQQNEGDDGATAHRVVDEHDDAAATPVDDVEGAGGGQVFVHCPSPEERGLVTAATCPVLNEEISL